MMALQARLNGSKQRGLWWRIASSIGRMPSAGTRGFYPPPLCWIAIGERVAAKHHSADPGFGMFHGRRAPVTARQLPHGAGGLQAIRGTYPMITVARRISFGPSPRRDTQRFCEAIAGLGVWRGPNLGD